MTSKQSILIETMCSVYREPKSRVSDSHLSFLGSGVDQKHLASEDGVLPMRKEILHTVTLNIWLAYINVYCKLACMKNYLWKTLPVILHWYYLSNQIGEQRKLPEFFIWSYFLMNRSKFRIVFSMISLILFHSHG